MARIIALMALTTLGLTEAPVHVPAAAQRPVPLFCYCAYISPASTAPAYVRVSKFGGHGADGFTVFRSYSRDIAADLRKRCRSAFAAPTLSAYLHRHVTASGFGDGPFSVLGRAQCAPLP